jgi:hypothetical protein
MATSTSTPIEDKKKMKDAMSDSKENNWSGFALSLLSNFIITVVIGLAGSNFIYLTRMASEQMTKTSKNNSVLEFLLPTKPGAYFPNEKNRADTNAYVKNLDPNIFTNCGKENNCVKAEPCTNYKRLAKFNIGTLGGWPYNMKDPANPAPWGLWDQFKYWLADSIADSYIRDRTLLQKMLEVFTPEKGGSNMFANQPFQMFVVTPLVYLFTPLVMFFSFFSILFSLFATSPGWAICGTFFFLSTFFISYGVSFVQGFQYMCTLTLVPLLADFKMVKNIFKCNGKALVYFFLFLTCVSAFANFDTTIASTVLVAYLLVLLKGYW